MSNESRAATWRTSEERDLGAFVIRLEIMKEPIAAGIWRSLGCFLGEILMSPFGDAGPSYAKSRVVKVRADESASPEVIDFGHDYESALIYFEELASSAR